MSMDVQVGQLSARYRVKGRLAAAGAAEKLRLDRALRAGAAELGYSLRECGIASDEILCILQLQTTARVSLRDSERALAEKWRLSATNSIREALSRGGPNVVRYRSRRHALSDFVLRAATGDTRRAWAFHELGFSPRGSATHSGAMVELALRALASDPPAIVPILAEAARRDLLGPLLFPSSPQRWSELGALALKAAGGGELRFTWHRSAPNRTLGAGSSNLATALEQSEIIRALERARSASFAPIERRALALLALLEVEPGAATFPERALHAIDLAERRISRTSVPEASPEADRAAAKGTPAVLPLDEQVAPEETRVLARVPREGVDGATRPTPGVETSDDTGAKTGHTRAGGLLFLIHLVRELELFEALAGDAALQRHAPRAVLHRLGLGLSRVALRDPATLAFAGLAPGIDPPESAPWDDAERAALAGYAVRLTAALAERVSVDELDPPALLRWLIRRDARIVADPGWLEARFSLRDVATEVRSAGLDLHPNWLSHLGVVMRFTYE